MRSKKIAVLTLLLLIILLGMHLIAMKEYWYIKYSSIDLPLHFLGGVCLALSTLYIFKNPKYIILSTFILGIFWEIFEVYYDITGWPFGTRNYNMDTGVDLLMDVLGSIFVFLVYKSFKKNEHISNIS
jgi:hypothetical protein